MIQSHSPLVTLVNEATLFTVEKRRLEAGGGMNNTLNIATILFTVVWFSSQIYRRLLKMLSWCKYFEESWLQDAWIINAAAGVSEPDVRTFLPWLLTIDSHVHVEGVQIVATITPRANHTDVSSAVLLLNSWHFGHHAGVRLCLALHSNATGCSPDDLGRGRVGLNTGNQLQGAEQSYGRSWDYGD